MVKKYFRFAAIAGGIILLDQALKYAVNQWQPEGTGGFFEITFIKNTGAGFGILPGQNLLLAGIALIVALSIIFFYQHLDKETFPQMLYALLLGGTLGNLLDRIFRGYVIDFLHFSFWPAFNIADASITAAVIGLAVYYGRKR